MHCPAEDSGITRCQKYKEIQNLDLDYMIKETKQCVKECPSEFHYDFNYECFTSCEEVDTKYLYHVQNIISEREVSVPEDLHFLAFVSGSDYREVSGSHHEVFMGHGEVHSPLLQFVLGHFLRSVDAGISLAEREMAGSVLIEERVQEKHS